MRIFIFHIIFLDFDFYKKNSSLIILNSISFYLLFYIKFIYIKCQVKLNLE